MNKPAIPYINIIKLADGCHNGACNVRALCGALGKAMSDLEGLDSDSVRRNRALKIIIGQIHFLTGQGLGTVTSVVKEYCAWKLDLILEYANRIYIHNDPELNSRDFLMTAIKDYGGDIKDMRVERFDSDLVTVLIHGWEHRVSTPNGGHWAKGWI